MISAGISRETIFKKRSSDIIFVRINSLNVLDTLFNSRGQGNPPQKIQQESGG
jgi:hypothetical protein